MNLVGEWIAILLWLGGLTSLMFSADALLEHCMSTKELESEGIFDWERSVPELRVHHNVVFLHRPRRHKKVVGQ